MQKTTAPNPTWQELLTLAFHRSFTFAPHPTDKPNARRFLERALQEGLTVAQIAAEARAIIIARECPAADVERRVAEALDLRNYLDV
jgi:hypothetical protein